MQPYQFYEVLSFSYEISKLAIRHHRNTTGCFKYLHKNPRTLSQNSYLLALQFANRNYTFFFWSTTFLFNSRDRERKGIISSRPVIIYKSQLTSLVIDLAGTFEVLPVSTIVIIGGKILYFRRVLWPCAVHLSLTAKGQGNLS